VQADATDYTRQRDRLDQDLALAEVGLQGTVVEHLDVKRIIGFVEGVLSDPSRLWEHATPAQRRKLARSFFPDGVTYEPANSSQAVEMADMDGWRAENVNGALRTATMGMRVNDFEAMPRGDIGVGSATGIRTPV